jgi:translation initiation factor IF-3
VKITIMFRGRETTHPERGERLLMRLAEDVADIGTVEQRPNLDGRNMTMVLAPVKPKEGGGDGAAGDTAPEPTGDATPAPAPDETAPAAAQPPPDQPAPAEEPTPAPAGEPTPAPAAPPADAA